jgi:hypothetical protein
MDWEGVSVAGFLILGGWNGVGGNREQLDGGSEFFYS